MDAYEYTVTGPGRDDGHRWHWEGGPVSFDASRGGEILDWQDRGSPRWTLPSNDHQEA